MWVKSVSVFSSPLRGEDTGEGDRWDCPLSLALSHQGREDLTPYLLAFVTPHLAVAFL